MTIDLRRFSLGKAKVTVERYSGGYSNGVFTKVLEETFDIWASVQPYSTVEQDQVVDPTTGEWIEEIRQMFCHEKINMNKGSMVSDIIIIDGEKWEPLKVEPWVHLDNEHYLVLLKRFDGD